MPAPLPSVGGQAVIEGVMMRAPGSFAVAVRRATGEIVVRERPWRSLGDRYPIFRAPLLRGIAVLAEGFAAGLEALSFAGEQAGLSGPLAPAVVDRIGSSQLDRNQGWALWGSLAMAFTMGLALFVALPHGMAVMLGGLFGGLSLQSVGFHVLAGVCKLVVFFAYLGILGQIPEIRRIFMYHGAEHKAIATFEARQPLEVVHARRHSTRHARCGTSFMLGLIILAIALFSVVFPLLPQLQGGWQGHLLAIALKVPLLLPVAAVAYEINRMVATMGNKKWAQLMAAPGLWLQKLTVREPTDEMLEVALVALKAALSRNRSPVQTAAPAASLAYQSFADACARQG